MVTASRKIPLLIPAPAALGPRVVIRPIIRLVRVRKREWSWLDSSFMAHMRDGYCKRAILSRMMPKKADPFWNRSSR